MRVSSPKYAKLLALINLYIFLLPRIIVLYRINKGKTLNPFGKIRIKQLELRGFNIILKGNR